MPYAIKTFKAIDYFLLKLTIEQFRYKISNHSLWTGLFGFGAKRMRRQTK